MKNILIIAAFVFLCASASGQTVVGSETTQALASSAQFRVWVGTSPANNSTNNLNPPIVRFPYSSNVFTIGYPATNVHSFRVQLTTNNWTTTNWDIVTSNNFYNAFDALTNANGSNWTGTNWIRFGYMNSNASPSTLIWSGTNIFYIAANATKWSRSKYADQTYLTTLGQQHPHMFFNTNNRAAMATFLHTNTYMGFNWASQITNNANFAIAQTWWNNDDITNHEPQALSEYVVFAALTYQIDSNAFWKSKNPGQMVDRLATAFMTYGYDTNVADSYSLNETTRAIALGYDWTYDDMTTAQRSNTLWVLERFTLAYMNGEWFAGSQIDPTRQWTTPKIADYESAGKINTSHGRHAMSTILYQCWAGMGESAILRDALTYAVNYHIGQFDPFDEDEGRGYAEEQWKTLHNFGAQLLMACDDPMMTNSPWMTKYPKMLCYWEPLNYNDLQGQFGDFGMRLVNGIPDTHQYNYKYYDLAIMYGNGAILRQFNRNFSIKSQSPDRIWEYGDAFLPYYFTNVPTEANWPDTYYFDESDGWCMSYDYPPNDWNCFTNGSGFLLTARPKGNRVEHGTWHDGAIQIWADGAQVTCGGVGEFDKHPIFYPGLFVDGIGDSTPNNLNPTFDTYARFLNFTNTSAFTLARLDMTHDFNNTNGNSWAGGGNGNLESAYNQSTNVRPFLTMVQETVLQMKHTNSDDYYLIYNHFQSTSNYTFSWKWNVMDTNTMTVNTNVGSMTYISTNALNGSNVTTYVQSIAHTNLLNMWDFRGTNYAVTNPITHEDFTSLSNTFNNGYEPWWGATEWINSPKTNDWFTLTVVCPTKWGHAAPTITRIDDLTMKIQMNDGSGIVETNTFNPNFAGAFTTKISLDQPANTFYVDTTNGNDSTGDGSIGSPWKTIQKAASTVTSGATVNVLPGTYNEYVTLGNSGTASQPITFISSVLHGAIVDPSTALTNGWVAASEIGTGVYKNTTTVEPKEASVNGQRIMFFSTNGDMTTQWNVYTSPPTTTGWGGMALPANQTVTLASGGPITYPFWQGVGCMYCYSNLTMYIRFADGHNPNGENIHYAGNLDGQQTFDVYKPAVNWNGKSYVTWQGFTVQGAFCQIDMEGTGVHNNTVISNYLVGGTHRMYLFQAYSNTIAWNEMTDNFYGTNNMGAWSGGTTGVAATDQNLWNISKFLAGGASVASHGIRGSGIGSWNLMVSNVFHHSLGEGILIGNINPPYATNNVIAYNISSNHVSHGIMRWPFNYNLMVYSNFIADCNVNIRLHILDNGGDTNSVAYYFRNKSWEPQGLGEHMFGHDGDSSGNTNVFPTLYCYNNSFNGGNDWLQVSAFIAAQWSFTNAFFFNNLSCSNHYYMNNFPAAFITNTRQVGLFDYNMITPPYPSFPNANDPAWLGTHVIKTNMWWGSSDQTLAINSDNNGIGRGIDLTAGGTINGRTLPAMPQSGTTMGAVDFVAPQPLPPPDGYRMLLR